MSDSVYKHDYKKIIYNFSNSFYHLRRKDANRRADGKKKPFKQISNEIKDLTGVYISHTQLNKYYNLSIDEDEQSALIPNIQNVLAIADYYEVSLEYMLGLSDSKYYEEKYKVGSSAFGLSDMSMTILEDMKSKPHIFNVEGAENNVFKKFSGSDLINFLLDKLIYEFQDCFNRYFYELQRLEHIDDINKNATIEITDIRNSFAENEKIEKELKDTKDVVNYRKYKISQLVASFVEQLTEEVKSRENEKEID